jgi:hypothetical protein
MTGRTSINMSMGMGMDMRMGTIINITTNIVISMRTKTRRQPKH